MTMLTEKNDRNSKEVEIIYIKDGKEITKRIPEYAARTSNIIYSVGSNSITVAEDIELLHIKNLHCNEDIWITCSNKDTILILEDCYFTEVVAFKSGHISIVNPLFMDKIHYYGNGPRYEGTRLYFYDTEDIDLTLGKRNAEDREMHKFRIVNGKNITISGDASNIKIESLKRCTKFHLKNVENFIFDELKAPNIIIEDSDKIEFNIDNNYKQLEIIDSSVKIDCNVLGRCQYEGGSVTSIKNSLLEIAGDSVMISDNVYHATDENKRLLFLNDECSQNGNRIVAATNLISSLKAISRLATEEGNKGFTEIHARYGGKTTEIEEEMKKYRQQIAYYNSLLKDAQTKINEISDQEHIACDKYQEEVNKKNIKSLIKK